MGETTCLESSEILSCDMMGSLVDHVNFTVKTVLAVWEMQSINRRGRQKRIEGGFVRK